MLKMDEQLSYEEWKGQMELRYDVMPHWYWNEVQRLEAYRQQELSSDIVKMGYNLIKEDQVMMLGKKKAKPIKRSIMGRRSGY